MLIYIIMERYEDGDLNSHYSIYDDIAFTTEEEEAQEYMQQHNLIDTYHIDFMGDRVPNNDYRIDTLNLKSCFNEHQ